MMLALSVQQPWAWLIVNGLKDVENRTWRTAWRGPILIHASKTFDREGYLWLRNEMPDVFRKMPGLMQYEFGGIVGQVEITDCVSESDSPWFVGPRGFVLRNAKPLPFMACRGMPGLFDIPYVLPSKVTSDNLS